MKSAVLALCTSVALVGCTSSSTTTTDSAPTPQGPTIVVTYSVLGSIVSELVGDEAEVSVIIPDGQDPHDFEPSAKDIEKLNEADLVVANGLGFEEGLLDALDSAHDRGVERFLVSDFVTTLDGEGHAHAHHSTDTSGNHSDDGAAIDPHVWLSPFAMSEMVDDLGAAITTATGLDVTGRTEALVASLLSLDERVARQIETLASCTLVTGHDELGYFADRYGCMVVGAVIPSFSTTAEASAGELADLKQLIERYDVQTVFTGLGTSSAVTERLAAELDVRAVELTTHFMDGAQTYDAFVQRLVDQIVTGLS